MAKFDYIEARKDALELIDEFGGNALGVIVTAAAYDPLTGANAVPTFSKIEIKAVELPINSKLGLSGDKQFQEDLKLGKIKGFYSASFDSNFNPEPGQFLIWRGKLFDIVAATPLSPFSVSVMFTIGCRESSKYDVSEILTALDVELTFFDS